jgi:hypothetical protein
VGVFLCGVHLVDAHATDAFLYNLVLLLLALAEVGAALVNDIARFFCSCLFRGLE